MCWVLQVLRLPAVGSKRFLTTKVDRCVTGAAVAIIIIADNRLALADLQKGMIC